MTQTEKDPDVTDEFFPATIVETVGEYNAETDTISVCVQSHRDPHKVFAQPLSEIPLEMREAATSAGYKFWAQTEITNIPVGAEQEGNESLKLSVRGDYENFSATGSCSIHFSRKRFIAGGRGIVRVHSAQWVQRS